MSNINKALLEEIEACNRAFNFGRRTLQARLRVVRQGENSANLVWVVIEVFRNGAAYCTLPKPFVTGPGPSLRKEREALCESALETFETAIIEGVIK